MAFSARLGGTNPSFGRDAGPSPTAVWGGHGSSAALHQPIPLPRQYCWAPPPPPPPASPPPRPHRPQPGLAYMSGFGGGTRAPQPYPAIDASIPAVNMTNSTGGVGCEPGYNYFFPAEHTKVHVLKSRCPPWQLPTNAVIPFHACHVPVLTTVGELLRGFGATNPEPKKNRVWEVVQGGNGRWYKGLGMGADNKDDMKRSLKELGWDKTRTGLPGQKPIVYLYVVKG